MSFHYILNADDLVALVHNARWFAGYYVRSKPIGQNRYAVVTNYPWEGAE